MYCRRGDLMVIFDFLSRAMAVALAIGAVLGFVLRYWIKAAIDTRFKRQLTIELEGCKNAFATSLEEKKAELTRDATLEIERLKNRLTKELEEDKRKLDEQARRDARRYDRTLAYYETFHLEDAFSSSSGPCRAISPRR